MGPSEDQVSGQLITATDPLDERLPFVATRASTRYAGLRLPVSVLLDNVRSLYNVGAFFRTADGAGVERLLLSGITARPPHPKLKKTALGADEFIDWRAVEDAAGEIRAMQLKDYEIAAVETSSKAQDLFDWHPRFPVCVLFGHEVEGLKHELAELCDTHVRIPMMGRKHSINVASAGAVVMYELLRKYRALMDRTPSPAILGE